MLGSQFGQGRGSEVDRVLGQVRVGHVALHTAHGQLGAEGAATTVLDHVTHQGGARRFADDAPVQTFLARGEAFDHGLGAVVRRAFFVAGDQEGDFALVIRVVGDKTLGGDGHGGEAAFHVGGATAAEHAVFVDQRVERFDLPGRHRAGRDHVGVAGEAQHRTVVLAVGGPEVIHIFDAHRFQGETGIAQALHHLLLAIGVDRRHGRTADQVDGELEGRRKVGVGRHGKLRNH
ncbi:hypothetical protein D3C80_825860 [compost metagenome]